MLTALSYFLNDNHRANLFRFCDFWLGLGYLEFEIVCNAEKELVVTAVSSGQMLPEDLHLNLMCRLWWFIFSTYLEEFFPSILRFVC